MKGQVRYGRASSQKANIVPITEQQIGELCNLTGESKSECVQAAITERYMRIVYDEQNKEIAELREYIIDLEKAQGGDLPGYIQAISAMVGDLNLARKIAALPDLMAVCEEVARGAYSDSDPNSLLETLQARAESVLRLANEAGQD